MVNNNIDKDKLGLISLGSFCGMFLGSFFTYISDSNIRVLLFFILTLFLGVYGIRQLYYKGYFLKK